MKTLNITFEDEEFEKLIEAKDKYRKELMKDETYFKDHNLSWHSFILSMLQSHEFTEKALPIINNTHSMLKKKGFIK